MLYLSPRAIILNNIIALQSVIRHQDFRRIYHKRPGRGV